MFHYLFTNDLRISNLESFLIEAGKCFVENKIPSASEDKNANNNMNTLGFYFNLTSNSTCAKYCANRNVRPVVLNFIKKFQFPNPRTTESLNEAINDKIFLAPLRIIIQTLYFMNIIDKEQAFLTDNEIAQYIFFNENIAKTSNPNVLYLAKEIIDNRNNEMSFSLEDDEELASKGFNWKHCKRQVRELVSVLTWAGCAKKDENGNIKIYNDNLNIENKAELFDILSYSEYWIPDANKNANENKKSYQEYMDIKETNNEIVEVDFDYLLGLKNQEFAFETIEILKKYMNQSVLKILCSNDESKKYTKHFRSILIDVTEYISNGIDYYKDEIAKRYYKDIIEINNRKYIISNDWYYKTHNDLDNKTPYLEFIKDIIKDAIRIKGGRNLIYYGVPGTGKSYAIDQLLNNVKDENKFRITFHPEYTYNDFIGQLLPTIIKEGEHKGDITYSFQKGPFTLALEKAYDTPQEAIYLIIEEMSRGNCAAIFGDIFQLLDRVKDGDKKDWSRYFVNNEVIAKDIALIKDERIKIPSNMYILGTVNTSDQNVFVMDTAFKRRFEWEYISTKPVPENKPHFNSIDISLNNGNDTIQVNWIDLYGVLNKFISSSEKLGLGEDKQIGQFFIEFDGKNDKEKIKNKLLHYLWFDIQEATYKTEVKLFDDSITSFSDLYDKYEADKKIFSDDFFDCIDAWNNNSL